MCAPKEVEAPVILAAGVYLSGTIVLRESYSAPSYGRAILPGSKNLHDYPRNVQKLSHTTRDGLLRSERAFWANRQILAHPVERPGQCVHVHEAEAGLPVQVDSRRRRRLFLVGSAVAQAAVLS